MKILKSLFICGLLVMVSSCNSDNQQDGPDPTVCPETYVYAEGESWESTEVRPAAKSDFEAILLNDDEKKIIETRNDFALSIFKELSKSPENTLFSPISLSLNLSMLSNGATGTTLDELTRASLYDGNSNTLDKKLIDGFVSADKTSRISIANSIWIDHSLNVLNDFITDNCRYYYAGIFRRDLSADATMDEINTWVEKNTSGIIPAMLNEPLEKGAKMTLANALYFYGSWVKSFDKELTHKEKFVCQDGRMSEVNMMVYSESRINYAETDFFRSVTLPFGNDAFRMRFILPKDNLDIDNAIASLSQDDIKTLESNTSRRLMPLSIPRFEISSDLRLREVLTNLGIKEIFSRDASFNRINPDCNLWVDDIFQKTIITVDEEGAEGAAATLMVMDGSSGDSNPLVFNRPFMFLIYEKSSGAILFVGSVKKL